jgi:hypothetical protein
MSSGESRVESGELKVDGKWKVENVGLRVTQGTVSI